MVKLSELCTPGIAFPGDSNALEGVLKCYPRSPARHNKSYSSSIRGRYESSNNYLKVIPQRVQSRFFTAQGLASTGCHL